MSQLGRVGGQVLADNLLRAGVDLAFETDLLYLDVINQRVGIKASTPSSVFEIPGLINTTDFIVDTQANIGNLRLIAPDTISTVVGGIDVFINGGVIFHDRLRTDNLTLDDNVISSSSNSNIVLDPNGSGVVELYATTGITGNLAVSGSIFISGNLSKQGNLILGDDVIDGEGNVPENDLVDFNAPFSQDLVPGINNAFDLGISLGDSTPRRWGSAHISDWTNINTLTSDNVIVSDQILINGVNRSITALQSNDDVSLLSATGRVIVEKTRWENNELANLLNTSLVVIATGTGYFNFAGTNAMVLPAGNNSERRISPDLGETRWNTQEGYLECFDGTIFNVSTGGGVAVTFPIMEELALVANLVLN